MIGHPEDNDQQPTLCVSQHSQPTSSSDRLRTSFLHKLGILEDRYRQPPPLSQFRKDSSLLGPVTIRHEPLKGSGKDDDNSDDGSSPTNSNAPSCSSDTLFTAMAAASFFLRTSPLSSPSSSPSSTSSDMPVRSGEAPALDETEADESSEEPRSVRFDERVTVIPIPKHDEYSQRILRCLWDSREVMMEKVQRNTLEFSADGWDWNAVAEENDHYACPATGELIHPIHVELTALERLDLEETIQGGATVEHVAASPL